MKNTVKLLVSLFAVIFMMVLSSCQKEEEVIPETQPEAKVVTLSKAEVIELQKEIALLSVLTQEQIEALAIAQKANGGTKLTPEQVENVMLGMKKDAKINKNLIIVRSLDSLEFIITPDNVIRFTEYMVINDDGDLVELLTLSQTYQIIDGKLDKDNYYTFDYNLDCPQNRACIIDKVTNAYSVKLFFIGDDGISFSYNAQLFDGNMVNIIPLEKGKWIAQGYNQTYGNSAKKFETVMFDCYMNTNVLNIAFVVDGSNIKSSVLININLLEGVNTIVLKGKDQDGNSLFEYPDVLQTIQLTELSFVATFEIKSVRINGRYGTYEYSTELITKENGISYYRLIQ